MPNLRELDLKLHIQDEMFRDHPAPLAGIAPTLVDALRFAVGLTARRPKAELVEEAARGCCARLEGGGDALTGQLVRRWQRGVDTR